jgi:hypothetical protein
MDVPAFAVALTVTAIVEMGAVAIYAAWFLWLAAGLTH